MTFKGGTSLSKIYKIISRFSEDKVVLHKSLYFKSAWANYATAKKGSLKLIPEKTILDNMEIDYQAMSEMFFELPPKWHEIVRSLKQFEKEFNK